MRGKLSEFDLYGILLLAAAGMKTGGLMLRRGDETVEVFLKDGDIVHATSPIGEGEKAIYYPIVWDEGFFALQANRSASARTIQRSSEQILEAVRAKRRELESARRSDPLPAMRVSAFRFCRGRCWSHYDPACSVARVVQGRWPAHR